MPAVQLLPGTKPPRHSLGMAGLHLPPSVAFSSQSQEYVPPVKFDGGRVETILGSGSVSFGGINLPLSATFRIMDSRFVRSGLIVLKSKNELNKMRRPESPATIHFFASLIREELPADVA